MQFEKEIRFIKDLYPGQTTIALHEPCFMGREKEYLADVIESTFVSSVGEYVNGFEKKMSEFTGLKHTCAVVNGTAALHTALAALGLGTNDEVITQPLTFIATVNAISYCGASPVFLDVERKTLGLSPQALGEFLDRHTDVRDGQLVNRQSGRIIRACLPVHIFGHSCRIDKIVEICSEYNLPVVEDCAESLGSLYLGKHTGGYGACGIFSLNGNKVVTSGGGGVIVTDDAALAENVKHISTTARVSAGYEFVHDRVGYNYRMPNLNAALACAQMENLEMFVENKRETASAYASCFKLSNLRFFSEPEGCRSNYWLNTVLAEDEQMRNRFLEESNRSGIMARPAWRLISSLPMYENCVTDSLKVAKELEKRIVNIPSSVRL